jgi:pantoate--beta-alanine ligase
VKTFRTVAELRAALEPFHAGRSVGLVPTMGAFHEGHLSLFRAARAENDAAVVSLFVNPAQFDDEHDLAAYPRDEERDARLAADAGIDFLFAPTVEEIYRPDDQTWVDVEGLSKRLEGEFRPGHFRGVATVCLKLFNIVRPQRAYFGQKDAQQAAVVERMVRDLELALEIRVLPTVREPDGLALSSRNVLLSPEERQRALALPRALGKGRDAFLQGSDPVKAARAELNGLVPDYVEVAALGSQRVLLAAVRVGRTRLIDNVILEVPCQASARLGRAQKGDLE